MQERPVRSSDAGCIGISWGGTKLGRLLVVSDYAYSTGGIEEFVVELLSRAAMDHECKLLSWSASVRHPVGFAGVIAVEYGDVRTPTDLVVWADVVVVVTSFNVRLLARFIAEVAPVKSKPLLSVVQTSQHSRADAESVDLQEAWLVELVQASDRVVAVSRDVEVALRNLVGEGLGSQKIIVIENASRLRPGAVERIRGRVTIGFIGRPFPQKGFPLFERLALELRDSGLKFRANTVSIKPRIEHSEIEYSDNLSRDELVEFFRSLDLLVAPYIRADGLPLAVLEALVCGVPVIGFDSPGLGSILRRYNQVVIEPDYASLAYTVGKWANGDLDIRPADPLQVSTWDSQIPKFLDLIEGLCR